MPTDPPATDRRAPFCEAAAEWDHDYRPTADGALACTECGARAYGSGES